MKFTNALQKSYFLLVVLFLLCYRSLNTAYRASRSAERYFTGTQGSDVCLATAKVAEAVFRDIDPGAWDRGARSVPQMRLWKVACLSCSRDPNNQQPLPPKLPLSSSISDGCSNTSNPHD